MGTRTYSRRGADGVRRLTKLGRQRETVNFLFNQMTKDTYVLTGDVEELRAFDANGNPTFVQKGSKSSVSFSDEQAKLLVNGQSTHNHPNNTILSTADIGLAVSLGLTVQSVGKPVFFEGSSFNQYEEIILEAIRFVQDKIRDDIDQIRQPDWISPNQFFEREELLRILGDIANFNTKNLYRSSVATMFPPSNEQTAQLFAYITGSKTIKNKLTMANRFVVNRAVSEHLINQRDRVIEHVLSWYALLTMQNFIREKKTDPATTQALNDAFNVIFNHAIGNHMVRESQRYYGVSYMHEFKEL